MMMQKRGGPQRGQLFTMDLVAAMLLAFASIALMISVSNDVNQREVEASRWVGLEYDAENVLSQLLYANTEPVDWHRHNYSNVTAVNLASGRGVLDSEKLASFVLADYNTTKEVIGIGTSEFYLKISSFNGKTAYYTYGLTPSATSNKYTIERPALLNATPVKVAIIVWRD